MKNEISKNRKILVTGATGYIGGRLVPDLLEAGDHVRVMIRGDASRLAGRKWADRVEIVNGNVLKPDSLESALDGIDIAYYFIHSMREGEKFHARDRQAAINFGQAAKSARVKRIVYLGGLGSGETLSEHLKSRQATGRLLSESGVETIEFRAAVIIGSGSAPFELIRHLTERLPILITPRWVNTRIQPIAIKDVLKYLCAAADLSNKELQGGQIIEIGGSDVLTYRKMMQGYAKERGLKRTFIPIPFLTPRLSSRWAHIVTPISASIAQPLIKGLRNEVIVKNRSAKTIFPDIEPVPYEQALKQALDNLRNGKIETIWNDGMSSSLGDDEPVPFTQEQGMFIERHEIEIDAPPAVVYRAFAGLGGPNGWPLHKLWQIRGLMDLLIGGVGLRRGRRHPNELRSGDALDFWRVEKIEQDHLLRLRAEMIVPGDAWLQFEVSPLETDESKSRLIQIAYFAPRGLLGWLYWYGVLPLHFFVFPAMLRWVSDRALMLEERRHLFEKKPLSPQA